MFIYMIAESSHMWSLKIYQHALLILFYLIGPWKILMKLLYYWMVSSLLRQGMWFSCKLCFQFEQSTWTIDSSRIWSWRKLANACAAVLRPSWRCTLMTMTPVPRRKRVSLPTQVHSILMCCVTQRQHKWNRSSEMPGTKPDWLQKARVFCHVIFYFWVDTPFFSSFFIKTINY